MDFSAKSRKEMERGVPASSVNDVKRNESMDSYNSLQTFAKHIPRLLLRQLITSIIEGVVISIDLRGGGGDDDELAIPSSSALSVACAETKTAVGGSLRELFVQKSTEKIAASGFQSIKRFHGALLFVDISGFTKLSQRLHVDALRHHINAYFHKILSIVDRYGGDVIKFAGDALFVIFQTECSSTGTKEFKQAAKRAVCKAVSCGKEITHTCSDYPVPLTGDKTKNVNSASLVSILQHQDNDPHKRNLAQKAANTLNTASAPNTAITTTLGCDATISFAAAARKEEGNGKQQQKQEQEEQERGQEKFTFLNVHAGVSIGTFAGVDVGAHNRWEYLLVSDVLGTVAEAEGQAGSGELVICAASHALAHDDEAAIQLPSSLSSSSNHSSPSSPRSSPSVVSSRAMQQEDAVKLQTDVNNAGANGEVGGARAENESKIEGKNQIVADFSLQQLKHVASQHILPCGCVPTLQGFYCIKPGISGKSEPRGVETQQTAAATGAVLRSGSEDQASGLMEGELKMMGAITEDISRGFALLVPSLRRTTYHQRLRAIVQKQHHRSTGAALSTPLAPSPSHSSSPSPPPSPSVAAAHSNPSHPDRKFPNKSRRSSRESSKDDGSVSVSAPVAVFGETALVSEEDELFFEVYHRWMKERLADECARHVHEASRGEFELPPEDLSFARSLMTSNVSFSLSPSSCGSIEQNVGTSSAAASKTSSGSIDRNGSVRARSSGVYDTHTSALCCALEAFIRPFEERLHLQHPASSSSPTDSRKTGSADPAVDREGSGQRVLTRSKTDDISSINITRAPPLTTSQATNLHTTMSTGTLSTTLPVSETGHGSISTGASFVARMRGKVSYGSSSAQPRGSLHSSRDPSFSHAINSNHLLRSRTQNHHEHVLRLDQALTAEVRSVIVLFISVDMTLQSLYLDIDHYTSPYASLVDENNKVGNSNDSDASIAGPFYFLPRSKAALHADLELLSTYQCCMQVVTGVLHEQGGQLRQFIVDDKGTVCIGTFGLRGGAHYDNAAAAIEAAGRIVAALRDEGLTSSIGVTSGTAYCGPVGSPQRHEYAVMGPSTNLSARLMGKARPFEVICDVETRKRDRTHTFLKLSSVQAKGYAQPVPTFKPLSDAEIAASANKRRGSVGVGLARSAGDGDYINYSDEFDSAMVYR